MTLMLVNNNYHLVHHDLPGVPWFALRGVYEASRERYVERSGGFLVAGYCALARLHALTPVAHPVHGNRSVASRSHRPASTALAGRFQVNFIGGIGRGERREIDLLVATERET